MVNIKKIKYSKVFRLEMQSVFRRKNAHFAFSRAEKIIK